ncbi:hypothetical protein [Streptomyces sp. NPDC055085]
MSAHIDDVVGPIRAAELINAYRQRLCREDLLSDRAALCVACTAYAWACVYVIAAPGQVWESLDGSHEQLTILGMDIDPERGYLALCHSACGLDETIPLDKLDARYNLSAWPGTDDNPGEDEG